MTPPGPGYPKEARGIILSVVAGLIVWAVIIAAAFLGA